jgi:hypothetical protein
VLGVHCACACNIYMEFKLSRNRGVAVTQISFLFNSQRVSVHIGHHQVILRNIQLVADYINYNAGVSDPT